MTRLLWMDFETDGYADNDPNVCGVLEVGWCLTNMNLDPLSDVEVSLVDPRDTFNCGLSRSRTIDVMFDRAPGVVREMHAENDLWNDARYWSTSNVEAMKTRHIEDSIIGLIDRYTDNRHEDVHLAGAGVGPFDRHLVRRLMPRLSARLHYAPYDISAYRRFVEGLQGRVLAKPEQEGLAHRAGDDVAYAILCARTWRDAA